MDLICYLRPGWAPTIRPAEATREWMDDTQLSFAYRCLPLNTANAHGWEILSPLGFEACWTGGAALADVQVRLEADADPHHAPVSSFGEGILTFHIHGLFRTPPGWNLWVGGSPNSPKDGIFPLTGVIETDWSPYTFTMNWRFTRRNHWIRFSTGEPICFIFPVQRTALEQITPRFLPLETEPQLEAHYTAWNNSRSTFLESMRRDRPVRPVDQWQKRYYRGVDMADEAVAPDHRVKLRLEPFAPVTPDAAAADPNAPITLSTDTATLGRTIADLAAALTAGPPDIDAVPDALMRSLEVLGLGESEAIEVVWAAIARAKQNVA
jgi:hypothetical protein